MSKEKMKRFGWLYIPESELPEPKTDREHQQRNCDKTQAVGDCYGLGCDDCIFFHENLQEYVKWKLSQEDGE